MNYSSRFFLFAPLVLFLSMAFGAGTYWWYAAGALSASLDRMNGHEAMPGVTLAFKSKSVGGFPFNLDVIFADLRVTVQTPHGPSSWSAEKFAMHGLTYGREQFIFEAAGRQMLRWTDLAGVAHAMPFEAGDLHASSITGERGLVRFDLDLVGLGSPALTAARVQVHARLTPDGHAVDVFIAADGVHLSPRLAGLFGPDITQLRLDASTVPSRPFDGLRAGRTDWVSALQTWRAANGVVQVNQLQIDWNKLSAMGKGRLALDAGQAVDGLLDFKIAGIQTLLDAAGRQGVRGNPNHGLAAALLDRAAQAGNNETGLLGAVIGFHGGVVSVGGEPATTEEKLY